MSYLTRNLKQTAVYWGSPVRGGMGGFSHADPVEIDCRWEDRQETFVDAKGQKQVSRSVVYLDQDVVRDGYLYLGDLDDLSSAEEGEPTLVDEAYLIRAFRKIPNRKATAFERKAWL